MLENTPWADKEGALLQKCVNMESFGRPVSATQCTAEHSQVALASPSYSPQGAPGVLLSGHGSLKSRLGFGSAIIACPLPFLGMSEDDFKLRL